MIYIKNGHILTLPHASTTSEGQELERLVAQKQLFVLRGCGTAFLEEKSGQVRPVCVARQYAYHRHELLTCAGGFVGTCQSPVHELSPALRETCAMVEVKNHIAVHDFF